MDSGQQQVSTSALEPANEILESIPDGFVFLDANWRFTYVNSAGERQLGRPRQDLHGKTDCDEYPEAIGTQLENEYHAVVRHGTSRSFEFWWKSLAQHFLYRVSPLHGGGLVVYLRDITAEVAARNHFAELEQIYRTAPVGLMFVDRDLRYVRINERMAVINGVPAEEHIGRTIWQVLPEMAAVVAPDYVRVISSGEPMLNREVTGCTAANPKDERTFNVSYYPVKNTGTVIGVSVVVEDITETKRSAELVRLSEERFRRIVETASEGIWIVDAHSNTTFVNDRMADLLGYRPDEILGRSCFEFIDPQDAGRGMEGLARRKEGDVRPREYRFNRKDGAVIWVNFNAGPMRDSRGELLGIVAMCTDVTERRKREEQLRQTNQMLATIIESSPLPIVSLTADGEVTVWNPAAERVFGWTEDEVLGRPLPFIPEEKRAEHRDMRARDLAGEGFRLKHIRRVRKGGAPIDLNVSTGPIRDEQARITGIMSLYIDITEQLRMEQALRGSEERYRSLVTATSAVVWTCDPEGAFIAEQPSWTSYTGQPYESAKVFGWREMLQPDNRERYVSDWNRSVEERGVFNCDVRLWQAASGEYRDVIARAVPILNEDGTIREWIGALTDVYVQKQAENRVAELNRNLTRRVVELETLLSLTPIGIAIASGRDCSEVRMNRAFAQWMRKQAGQNVAFIGPDTSRMTFRARIDGRELSREELPLETAAREGRDVEVELEIIHDDGKVLNLLCYATPLLDEAGTPRGSIGAFVDMTDRKQMLQALRGSNAILRRMNEDLKQFAYAASHDLKEPLRMMSLYSQVLARKYSGKLDAHADEALSYIQRGSSRMQELVDDLLEFTQAGDTFDEQPEPVESEAAVNAALENLKSTVEQTGAHVRLARLPVVRAHTTQLVRVFQNLIGNALKYRSEDRTPEIDIGAEAEDDMWKFCVRDNGIGISPRYHERIFGVFKRLHKDRYPGNGIGLAICQRVIERYGGRIWVESEEGRGASFCFTLPRVSG
jgi:PAS domain S-box-containing protein